MLLHRNYKRKILDIWYGAASMVTGVKCIGRSVTFQLSSVQISDF